MQAATITLSSTRPAVGQSFHRPFHLGINRDSYQVENANVTLAKSSLVVEDPFNGVTNPKAIPGARVTYTIDLGNTGDVEIDDGSGSITPSVISLSTGLRSDKATR